MKLHICAETAASSRYFFNGPGRTLATVAHVDDPCFHDEMDNFTDNSTRLFSDIIRAFISCSQTDDPHPNFSCFVNFPDLLQGDLTLIVAVLSRMARVTTW